MSDGITLHCPRCGKHTALKKEYDELKVVIGNNSWATHLPVYTCQDEECGMKCVIEFVTKSTVKTGVKDGKGN